MYYVGFCEDMGDAFFPTSMEQGCPCGFTLNSIGRLKSLFSFKCSKDQILVTTDNSGPTGKCCKREINKYCF